MIEIEREGVVPGRPDAVWGLVEDVRRLPMWLAFAQRAELIEGAGIGRRQRIRGTWGSKRTEVDQVVTAFEPGRLLTWRHEGDRGGAETRFSVWLEPEGGATRVRLVWQQEPRGKLREVMLRSNAKQVARQMEKSLDRLKMVAAAL